MLALVFAGAAAADFKVVSVQAKFADQSLTLTGDLDLSLSARVEEALSKGIPLEVSIEIRLNRPRRFMWDVNIADWTLQRRIQYHALSGQYLVMADASSDLKESFLTLQEALKQMGSFSDLRLTLAQALPAGEHTVEVRATLDIEALPAPLRPVAYTSRAWRLNSGWTTWKVAP